MSGYVSLKMPTFAIPWNWCVRILSLAHPDDMMSQQHWKDKPINNTKGHIGTPVLQYWYSRFNGSVIVYEKPSLSVGTRSYLVKSYCVCRILENQSDLPEFWRKNLLISRSRMRSVMLGRIFSSLIYLSKSIWRAVTGSNFAYISNRRTFRTLSWIPSLVYHYSHGLSLFKVVV